MVMWNKNSPGLPSLSICSRRRESSGTSLRQSVPLKGLEVSVQRPNVIHESIACAATLCTSSESTAGLFELRPRLVVVEKGVNDRE